MFPRPPKSSSSNSPSLRGRKGSIININNPLLSYVTKFPGTICVLLLFLTLGVIMTNNNIDSTATTTPTTTYTRSSAKTTTTTTSAATTTKSSILIPSNMMMNVDNNNNNSMSQPPQPNDDNYVAYQESLGFFDDISSQEWEQLKAITRYYRTRDSQHNFDVNTPYSGSWFPRTWYQEHWDPDFSCRHEAKVGTADGGKWLCDPHRLMRTSRRRKEENIANNIDKAGCIVYSVGSNGDFGFELELSTILPDACEIHVFDFTDYSDLVPPGRNIHFHPWGLKPSYTEKRKRTSITSWTLFLTFGQARPNAGEFKTFEETKKALGHEGLPIDIFKIDCEGCEWSTYKDWIDADIRQLLVEVHHVPQIANDFFTDLRKAGYVTYHKEPNIQYGGGECLEYAMLKLSLDYIENSIQ